MVMNVANAVAAYKNGGGLASMAGGAATPTASGSETFADTLGKFAGDAVGAMKEGEQAVIDGATGKASIASVVTALSQAELMLQTVTVIRDKVIAAYQDITKTQI